MSEHEKVTMIVDDGDIVAQWAAEMEADGVEILITTLADPATVIRLEKDGDTLLGTRIEGNVSPETVTSQVRVFIGCWKTAQEENRPIGLVMKEGLERVGKGHQWAGDKPPSVH